MHDGVFDPNESKLNEEKSEREEFSGFKEAIIEQYKTRYLALKRQADEEIADMIAARRIEVEKTVHELLVSCERKLAEGLRANRRHAELRVAAFQSEILGVLLSELEERAKARIGDLRCSQRYGLVMRSLAEEADRVIQAPVAALVEKGDAVHLKSCKNIREVREELDGAWGGLMVVELAGARLIDNTLRARWKRLSPVLMQSLQRHVAEHCRLGEHPLSVK